MKLGWWATVDLKPADIINYFSLLKVALWGIEVSYYTHLESFGVISYMLIVSAWKYGSPMLSFRHPPPFLPRCVGICNSHDTRYQDPPFFSLVYLVKISGVLGTRLLHQFGCYQHRCEWKGARVCGALVQFGCYQHRHEWMLRPHPY